MPWIGMVPRLVLIAGVVVALLSCSPGTSMGVAEVDGARLYRRHCAPCHGIGGRGDGTDAAVFAERPRDLREGFLRRYSTDDLVRRVRDGEPLELALDLPRLRAHASAVEAIVAHMKRLPTINWHAVQRGWEVFISRCEGCHGTFGHPPADLPPGVRPPRDLSDPSFQWSVDDEALVALVRHGRKAMPALTPRIAGADGPPLSAFVRLLSPGLELYSRYCAGCHGDDGRGAGTVAEALHLPMIVFDQAYFSRRDANQIREAVWAMLADQKPAMPHYRATLDSGQVRAIIEYLKRRP